MTLCRTIMLLTITVGLTAMAGCQSQPGGAAAGPEPAGPTRSLVFASPGLRWLSHQVPPEPGRPWYADRRDAELGVVVGLRSATRLRSVTVTVDRQYLIHGRVFDHFRTTTYRERVTEEIR